MIVSKGQVAFHRFKAVVIGASAGGINALEKIIPQLPNSFPLPIIIVLHLSDDQPSMLSEIFSDKTKLRVKDAEEKEAFESGTIYFAPPGYHLLIEHDQTFSLSTEKPVRFSRPSIDVLFESAAYTFGSYLLGVVLSGASNDGADGLKKIQDAGGLALVENPATAQVRTMPEAGCAMISASADQILSLDEIANFLVGLAACSDAGKKTIDENKKSI